MKKILGSVDLQAIVCVVLCALLLAGLFMPVFSYGNMADVLREMADEAYYYEQEQIYELLAEVLEEGNYTQKILEAYADFEWEYSAPSKRDDPEEFYEDIMDRLESKIERKEDGLESILDEFEDDIEDALYYDDMDEAAKLFSRLLDKQKIIDYAALYLIYYTASLYCYSYSEALWDSVELSDYMAAAQSLAGAIADNRLSAVEVGSAIRAASMAADVMQAIVEEELDEDDIEEIRDGEQGYGSAFLIGIYDAAPALRAAKIAWTLALVVYALMVLAIAALALIGKKRRGFGLSIAITAINVIFAVALLIVCGKANGLMNDSLDEWMDIYLSVKLYSATFWAFVLPFAAAALAVLTRRLSMKPSYATAGGNDYDGYDGYGQDNYSGYAPSGWTCSCGNVCSDSQRFCTNCGRTRPTQPTVCRCTSCGNELDGDEEFCPYCGQRQ